ncbi:MAG TPA: hypothetical protein VL882_09475 [Vicinamibacterales bacterium]|nr:hypothetical protein [Vicinamibacterales bacterium]
MLKQLTVLMLATGSLLTAGCLQKETSHTLYLSSDGSVEWVTSEASVHSTETDPAKQMEEEQGYIGGVWLQSHGVARGLAALGPVGVVQTTVVRGRRPFHVITSANFTAVDRVFVRLFTEMAISTSASLEQSAAANTLRVRLDFSRQLEEHETPVSQLADNIEHLRIVLTDGRFGTVSGFDVVDGTTAALSAEWVEQVEKAYERKGAIEFRLSWSLP